MRSGRVREGGNGVSAAAASFHASQCSLSSSLDTAEIVDQLSNSSSETIAPMESGFSSWAYADHIPMTMPSHGESSSMPHGYDHPHPHPHPHPHSLVSPSPSYMAESQYMHHPQTHSNSRTQSSRRHSKSPLHADPLADAPAALLAAARASAIQNSSHDKYIVTDTHTQSTTGTRSLLNRLMELLGNDDFVRGLFVGVAAGAAITFYAQRGSRRHSRSANLSQTLNEKQAELDRLANLLKHCLSMLLNSKFYVCMYVCMCVCVE